MATILEALENAEMNIDNFPKVGGFVLALAKEQIHNARVLLEKGYSVDTEVEDILVKYETVEAAPEITFPN